MNPKKSSAQDHSIPIDPDLIIREIYTLVKSSTEKSYDALSALQNQTEKIASLFLENYSSTEAEGRLFVSDWVASTKHKQVELQKAYQKGIDKIAELIMPNPTWEFEFDPAADPSREKIVPRSLGPDK